MSYEKRLTHRGGGLAAVIQITEPCIRGIGPSLYWKGVSNYLPDPQVTVLNGSSTIDSNNDWPSVPRAIYEELFSNGVYPEQSQESVVWPTLAAGSQYTMQIRDVNGGSGIALFEMFEY
jgi:hypothetical protein